MIGAGDADITVSLQRKHHPTADYVRILREKLPQEFPGVTFYFLPADIITQILNFGLPAPIDVQIEGSDVEANRGVADQILNQLRRVPGIADLRIQQAFDYPSFNVDVDRTKAMQGGYTEADVAGSLLNSLSGSFQTSPMFFLNWRNGVELQPGGPGSTVRHPVPAGSAESFLEREKSRAAGNPCRCRLHPALARDASQSTTTISAA